MRTLLLLMLLVVAVAPGCRGPAEDGPLATISVDAAQPGLAIPARFMGFSHEWSGGPQLMGSASDASDSNPIYQQLIRNLLAYGGGPLVVRIGGNSTDFTAVPSPETLAPFARLYNQVGARFVLGVNLGSRDVSLAANQARAYLQAMPTDSLEAIEIGNEPDLYHTNGHRDPTYAYADFANDFAAWRSAILPLLPRGVGLMGPSWVSQSALKDLPAFLDREAASLTLVSQHWYAGTRCNGKTNPSEYLLQPEASASGAKGVADSVALAHRLGLPFRMAEMNSISCGGEPGVSDIFAAALWSADSMFELATAGVDGVNVHTGNGGAYALFAFGTTTTQGQQTYTARSIRPEYYGLLFFQQAAPGGSRLLRVDARTNANLKAWATIDVAGVVRITIINKDRTAAGRVVLHVAASNGPARVVRLEAPAFDAQTGIRIGGQTFDGSPDGTLTGSPVEERLVDEAGAYTLLVSPASAALVTLG